MNPLIVAGAGLVLLLVLMIVVVLYSTWQSLDGLDDQGEEIGMYDERELIEAEQRYDRLRADVRAAREKIGDAPCKGAGLTAVALLEKVLDRHPPILNEHARQQARGMAKETTHG